MARVYIQPGVARLQVTRKLNPVLKAGLKQAGESMVNTANSLMTGDFDLERPYERRRYPGSRRAKSALDYTVTETSREQLQVRYRVLGGEVVLKRILGMNFGVGGGHRIVPSGTWELKGAGLSVRSGPTPGRFGPDSSNLGIGGGSWLYFPVPEGGKYRRAKSVQWRPTGTASKGTGFLEESRDLAADFFKSTIAS